MGRPRSYYLDGGTGPLSPLDMIRRVENLIAGQARREDLLMEVVLDESIPVIESEERAFKQLIYHLILNGIDRGEPGSKVRVVAERDDDYFVFSVTDSGPEVVEEIRPRPAPPVTEKEATETLAPPLLGLPLCATLAERLGATLTTASDSDGVHFVVKLPLLRS